jgi:hypothetical protein
MWRGTTETGTTYKIPITPECVRAVYLRLAISDEDRSQAVTAVSRKFPTVEVWQAKKRHGDLALNFEPV